MDKRMSVIEKFYKPIPFLAFAEMNKFYQCIFVINKGITK